MVTRRSRTDRPRRISVLNVPRRDQLSALWTVLQDPYTLYWRLEGTGLKRADLDPQFAKALANGGFDSTTHIRQIVVDELDRADPDDMLLSMRETVQALCDVRFILISRAMPLTILRDPELRQHVEWHAPQPAAGQLGTYEIVLQTQAFGAGQVLVNGHRIDDWGGNLPRHLFFYLIHHPRAYPAQIHQALWSHDEQGDLHNLLNAVHHRLREVLGGRLVHYRGGAYQLMPHVYLDYDVTRFQALLKEAQTTLVPEQRLMALEEAARLYRNDFLLTIQADWAQQVRRELAARYHETVLWLGELHLEAQNTARAIYYLSRAIYCHPDHAQTVTLLMRAYLQDKDGESALTIYRRYLRLLPADQYPHETLLQLAADAEALIG